MICNTNYCLGTGTKQQRSGFAMSRFIGCCWNISPTIKHVLGDDTHPQLFLLLSYYYGITGDVMSLVIGCITNAMLTLGNNGKWDATQVKLLGNDELHKVLAIVTNSLTTC